MSLSFDHREAFIYEATCATFHITWTPDCQSILPKYCLASDANLGQQREASPDAAVWLPAALCTGRGAGPPSECEPTGKPPALGRQALPLSPSCLWVQPAAHGRPLFHPSWIPHQATAASPWTWSCESSAFCLCKTERGLRGGSTVCRVRSMQQCRPSQTTKLMDKRQGASMKLRHYQGRLAPPGLKS